MATKNIVPRIDNEGQIGRESKRWSQGNFVTGSFGLISGSLIPDVSGDKPAFTLGSSTHAWKELYVVTSSIKFVDPTDNSVVQTITADSTGLTLGDGDFSGSVASTGSFGYLYVATDAFIGGNVVIGDAVTDSISIQADLSSSLTPDTSDTYNLGSDSQRWNDLYLSGSLSASGGPHHIISATTIDIDAEGALTIDGGSLTIGGDSDVAVDFDSSTFDLDASGAVTIDSTAGVSIDAGAASNLSTSAGALTVHGAGGVNLGTTADVAFDIDTSTLDIDSSGAITIDSTAGISLDAGAASNLTTSAGALTLQAQENGLNLVGNITASANISGSVSSSIQVGGSITGSGLQMGSGLVNIDGNVDIDNTTTTIDSSGAISLDAAAASNFTTTAGALTLKADENGLNLVGNITASANISGSVSSSISVGGSITGSGLQMGSGLVNIDGTVDVDNDTFSVDSSGAISLDAGATSNLTTSAGDIDINAAANLDLDGATIDIDSAGALSLQGGAASDLTTSVGAITVDGKTGVTLKEDGTAVIAIDTNRDVLFSQTGGSTSDPDVEIDGYLVVDGTAEFNGTVDIDGTVDVDNDTFSVDSSGAVSIDGGAASNFTTTAGALTLKADDSGLNLVGNITASGQISGSVSSSIQIGGSITASAANIPSLNSDSTVTIDGATGVTIQEGGTNVIAIDTNRDVLFSQTGGSTSDPDVEIDGYLIVDGTAEFNGTVQVDGTLDVNSTTMDVDVTNFDVDASSDISLDAGASSNFTTSTGDIDINAAANLDLDGATIDIDSAGALSIDAAAASNLTTTVGALTLKADDGLNLVGNITASGQISGSVTSSITIGGTLNAAQVGTDASPVTAYIDAGEIDGTTIGGESAGAATFTTINASSLTTSGDIRTEGNVIAENYIVSSSVTYMTASFSSGSTVFGDSNDDTHQFTGSVDISGSFTVNSHGLITGSNLTIDNRGSVSGSATSTGSFGAGVTANAIKVGITAAGEIDSTGTITIDGATGVNIQEGGTDIIAIDTNQDVLFSRTGGSSGDPDVEIDGYLVVDGTAEFNGTVDIDGTVDVDNDTFSVDSSGAISLDAGATSNLTTSAGDIDINAAANLDLDGATIDIDSAGALSIDAAAASNFTTTAGALTLKADEAGLNLVGNITASANISGSVSSSIQVGGSITGSGIQSSGPINPAASDGASLGQNILMWSDLFLGSGGVINFNNGDITATHTSNLLTITGGNTRVDRLEIDGANDYLDVDTDLKIISAADIILDPGGNQVLPGSDNADDLGASGTRWRNVYTTDLQLSNVGTDGNDVDGTTGNWTMQEGDDNIYLINNLTGKKFKITLEEII